MDTMNSPGNASIIMLCKKARTKSVHVANKTESILQINNLYEPTKGVGRYDFACSERDENSEEVWFHPESVLEHRVVRADGTPGWLTAVMNRLGIGQRDSF